MCAREALRGALRARPRIEDGLSAHEGPAPSTPPLSARPPSSPPSSPSPSPPPPSSPPPLTPPPSSPTPSVSMPPARSPPPSPPPPSPIPPHRHRCSRPCRRSYRGLSAALTAAALRRRRRRPLGTAASPCPPPPLPYRLLCRQFRPSALRWRASYRPLLCKPAAARVHLEPASRPRPPSPPPAGSSTLSPAPSPLIPDPVHLHNAHIAVRAFQCSGRADAHRGRRRFIDDALHTLVCFGGPRDRVALCVGARARQRTNVHT